MLSNPCYDQANVVQQQHDQVMGRAITANLLQPRFTYDYTRMIGAATNPAQINERWLDLDNAFRGSVPKALIPPGNPDEVSPAEWAFYATLPNQYDRPELPVQPPASLQEESFYVVPVPLPKIGVLQYSKRTRSFL